MSSKISIQVTGGTHRKLRVLSSITNLQIQQLVEQACDEYIARHPAAKAVEVAAAAALQMETAQAS